MPRVEPPASLPNAVTTSRRREGTFITCPLAAPPTWATTAGFAAVAVFTTPSLVVAATADPGPFETAPFSEDPFTFVL